MTAPRDLPARDGVSSFQEPSTVCSGVGGKFAGRGEPTWLSVAAAATLLDCSRRHVYRILEQFTTRTHGDGARPGVELALESLPDFAVAKYFAGQNPQLKITVVENEQLVLDVNARAKSPRWARDKADTKKLAVEQFRTWWNRAGMPKIAALQKYCESQPFHWQSLNRWLAAEDRDGYQGLIDGYGNRAANSVLSATDRRILHGVYVIDGGSKAQAFNRLAQICEGEGREAPSAATVNRYLAHYSVRRGRAYHAGPDTFNESYEPHTRLDYDALRPLDVVSADHHRLDVFAAVVAKRDRRGKPVKWKLVRPWLTTFHDDKSKRLLGWYISIDHAPNHLTIHQAFIMMVTESGVPRRVKFDNGKDFLHRHFIGGTDHQRFRKARKGLSAESELPGVMTTLDVKFTAVRAYHGASKRVERTFKEVVNSWATKHPTYCGKGPEHVPERSERARKLALKQLHETGETKLVMTADEFVVAFATWVDDVYHQTKQDGHAMAGRTPTEVWNQEVHDRPVRKLSVAQIHYLLMKRQRAVARDGIEFKGATYWADEIGGDVKRDVIIEWDPADLSKIYICNPDGSPLCVATRDKRSSQFADEGQFRELARRRKNVKKKAREFEGDRHSLAEQEIRLRQARELDRAAAPLEPEPAQHVAPLFGAAVDQAAFFQQYEKRQAANAPLIPESDPPANLVHDFFNTRNTKPVLAPDAPLTWDEFYEDEEDPDGQD